MRRDVDQLAARTFDVLVVGGGIYGLTIACDAATRGLSVALIERDDFGSGSSFNHLRTIHGGLRYLQTFETARARESVRERRTLARIAPHAVRPLLFALPLYRSFTRGSLAMRAGFLLDRLIARDRNDGVPESLKLPAGRVISRGEAIDRFPGLPRRGLTGAALWYDYVTLEADRLTFAWALAAAAAGAAMSNHLEATVLLTDGRKVLGVRAKDLRTGREMEIAAHMTVNATGASVGRLVTPIGVTVRLPLLKAMNLVTRLDAGNEALGARSPSGRHVFLVPWRGRALFGTWESPQPCGADDTAVNETEIATFVDELNHAFPSLDLKISDVTLVHRGVVPAVAAADGSVTLEGREQIYEHSGEHIEGLVSVAGTKYTTARAVAERVVDHLFARLQRGVVPCRTAVDRLPGGDIGDGVTAISAGRKDYDAMLPSDTLPHLVAAYGSRYGEVVGLAEERPDWRVRIAEGSPVIGAELVWAVRREMAMTLNDAVIRRTPLGALGFPGDEAAERAAQVVGAELGWSDEQRRAELAALRSFYKPV